MKNVQIEINEGTNFLEKYYLPKENEVKKRNINFFDYSSLLSTSSCQLGIEEISKSNNFQKIFFDNIIPFLSIKDLISLKISNKLANSFINKKAIDICILSNSTHNFNSPKERTSIWNYLLDIEKFKITLYEKEKIKFENNTQEKNNNIKNDKLYYEKAIELSELIKKNESDKIGKFFEEKRIKLIKESFEFIRRDIDRTYYIDYFIKGDGKNELRRVLESSCTLKDNIGYCQGMNFIVGAMVYLTKSEINGFYMFNCLLNSYELNTLFSYNTPDYNTRVYQLNHYVKKYIPDVYHHFKNNNLSFDLLYSGWMLTLFSNYFDIEKLDFPWTCFIIDRWKGLIKICLIIIYELKNQLIKCNLEGISLLLKDNNMKYHKNYSKSLELYRNKFKVTNNELIHLKNEYYSFLVQQKLEETNEELDQWEEDQKGPLTEYLREKEKIEKNVFNDIESYKLLNEELTKKLLITLQKYNNLLKYINSLKERIEKLANMKYSYEELFNYYIKAIDEIKNDNKGNFENAEKKKEIINNEKNSLLEKYLAIKDEFNVKNELLYKEYDEIDKLKIEIKKIEQERNKRRMQMQDYLFLYEKKKDELIKNLSEKLKHSKKFISNNKF